jgi:deoxyhypusine synthase
MDTITGLILGACGSLIVGIILLLIQHSSYFQKKKINDELQKKSGEEHSLWKYAIDKAVQDFSKNHTDGTIKIQNWTVRKDKAQVRVVKIIKEVKERKEVKIDKPNSPPYASLPPPATAYAAYVVASVYFNRR